MQHTWSKQAGTLNVRESLCEMIKNKMLYKDERTLTNKKCLP